MKVILSLHIFLIIFFVLECYDKQPWTRARKSGEIKIDENDFIVKIGKTIYTAVGYFSKSAKQTAKEKLERIIKKEINKKQ